MNSLENIRYEIDSIDNSLKELFLKRIELSKQVAQTKLHSKDDIYKPQREHDLKARLGSNTPLEYQTEYQAFLNTILRTSRKYQYNYICSRNHDLFPVEPMDTCPEITNVYYQGIPGSYSHEVCQALYPNAIHHNKSLFSETFDQVTHINDCAIVPFENSCAGVVNEARSLLCYEDLYINAVYNKKISHCLCAYEPVDSSKPIYIGWRS